MMRGTGVGGNQHLDDGKNKAPEKRRSTHSIMEASVRTVDTIREDWDTTSEREARIKEECEKNGEKFHPEDDWSMAERQRGDKARAEEKEAQRRKKLPGACVQNEARERRRMDHLQYERMGHKGNRREMGEIEKLHRELPFRRSERNRNRKAR